jgi:hypothetical protein
MKRLLAPFLLFLLGSFVGFCGAASLLSWTSSSYLTLITISPETALMVRLKLALAAGALFAAATIAPTIIARSSRPAAWSIAYLGLGLMLTAAAAEHYREVCANIRPGPADGFSSETFFMESSPLPWALLIFAGLLLSLGLVHRSMLGFLAKSRQHGANAP